MKIQEVSDIIGGDLRCLDHWLLDTLLSSYSNGSGYVFTARVAIGMGKKLWENPQMKLSEHRPKPDLGDLGGTSWICCTPCLKRW